MTEELRGRRPYQGKATAELMSLRARWRTCFAFAHVRAEASAGRPVFVSLWLFQIVLRDRILCLVYGFSICAMCLGVSPQVTYHRLSGFRTDRRACSSARVQ